MSDGLLHGLAVAEVADPLTEHAGRILAELGADVTLIEPPAGSLTRHRRPFVATRDPSRRSIPFLARNAGKTSVTLDPANEQDRASLGALIRRADVVIAPCRSPFIDNDAVESGQHDATVVVTIDDDGLGRSALVAFAAGGGLSSSGFPEKPPCNAPSWLALDAAGVYAAGLALTGVWAVRHGMHAPRYTVSLREAALAGITPWTRPLMSYGMSVAGQGVQPGRLGAGPYPVYPCRDGYVRVLTGTPRQWEAWRALLGNPEALSGDEWEEARYRAQNFDAIVLIGAAITRERTRADLFREGQRLGLTITPVFTPADLLIDAHVEARGFLRPLYDPDLGRVRLPRAPVRFSNPALDFMPPPAPTLAAHTAEAVILPSREGTQLTPVSAEAGSAVTAAAGAAGSAAALPTGGTATAGDRREGAAIVARAQSGERTGQQPLGGLRVLNLGVGAVAPELASLMALLGAEVIKIESRRYPDFLRRNGINGPGDYDGSPAFNQLNLGVLSCAVDLSADAGRDVVRRLVPHCDVVMENLRGGVARRWGLDYAGVRALRPDIVYLSSQGLGDGVYNDCQTYGPNLQAFSGISALWGHPDDPYPAGATLNHPDHLAGKQALAAVLGALLRRDATGEGLFIDAAQFEFGASLLADKLLEEQRFPGSPRPLGNRSLDAAPHGVYRCREAGSGEGKREAGPGTGEQAGQLANERGDAANWIALAVMDDGDWVRFGAACGEPWTRDPRFATAEGRLEHVDHLNRLVDGWTGRFTSVEVESRLRQHGVLASRIVTGFDIVERAGDHGAGIFAALAHPVVGTRWYTGLPFSEAAAGRPALRRPPLLGEHTEYVLYDIVGLYGAEVSALMEAGTVGY